jgi:hypothetical protein
MNLDKHKAPHSLFNLSRFVTAAINEEKQTDDNNTNTGKRSNHE